MMENRRNSLILLILVFFLISERWHSIQISICMHQNCVKQIYLSVKFFFIKILKEFSMQMHKVKQTKTKHFV